MQPLRLFIDTHDRTKGTFPETFAPDQFNPFFASYEEACRAEGVVTLRVHVALEEGRAFCLNMAPDADAVRRAHERAGLPFDSISEVQTATPGEIFFLREAAGQQDAGTAQATEAV